MKLKALLFSILLLGYGKTQVELVARFDEALNSTLNSSRTKVYTTSSQIYSVNDTWDNRVRRINPLTKKLELVDGAPRMYNVFSGYESPSAFYYTATLGNPNRVVLVKIDNALNVSELFSFQSDNAQNHQPQNSFAYVINERVYFHIRSTEHNAIYEFNPDNEGLTLKITHAPELSLISNSIIDDMFFYTVGTTGSQQLFVFDGNESRLIISGAFDPAFFSTQPTTLLKGGNQEYVFFRVRYSNDLRAYYRIHRETKESELYFTTSHEFSTYFEHHGKEYFDRRSLSFDGDSTIFSPLLAVKNEFLDNQFPGPILVFPELKVFQYSNRTHGNEFYIPDVDDSLTLLTDFNPDIAHSYPVRFCDGWSSSSNTISFSHQGKHYVVVTNGNDSFLYLYELTSQGLVSKFCIKDYKQRIRFIPKDDFLYYMVYDLHESEVKMYRVRWSQMNDTQPSENSFDSDVWSTQVMYARKTTPCQHGDINARALDIMIDQDANVVASFQNGAWSYSAVNAEIIDFRNKYKQDLKVPHCIAKYSPNGDLIWLNTVGERAKAFQHNDRILIDKNENILVFGTFFRVAYFDEDSLTTLGSARFFAKLHRETGTVIDKKVIFQTSYIDDVEHLQAVLGEDNHVYLAGKYTNFSQNFGDTTLHSHFNHQNFLAKYDNTGNLIWVRNINHSWTEIVGDIQGLNFNEDTGEIHVYCTQNYNFWCDDLPYQGETIGYNLDGNEIHRKIIDGRYRHFGGEIAQLNARSLLIAGSFQGNISGGVYEQFTQKDDDCFVPAGYLLQLDINQNKLISGYYTTNNAISFTHSVSDENYLYLVGNNHENHKLTIVRFDREGNYQGEKELNQRSRAYKLAFKNGYFAMIMVNPNQEDFLHFHASQIPSFSEFDRNESFGIFRFKIQEWDYRSNYMPMNVKQVDKNLGIFAFPNPAYDKIQFNFQDNENQFENYQICDASGRVLKRGKIPNQNFLILQTHDLEPGLYHAIFTGEKIKSSIKFIKQN